MPLPPILHLWVRRALPPGHPAATMAHTHRVDFGPSAVSELSKRMRSAVEPEDVAVSALGTTIAVAGSPEAFRAVDFDAVLAFATAARKAGIKRFAVVSALGADAKSRNFYNRVKGEAEAALAQLGFETLILARPSLLAGDRASLEQAPRRGEQLALAITGPLSGLIPLAWRPIQSATVARALLQALRTRGPGAQVIESAELQALGR